MNCPSCGGDSKVDNTINRSTLLEVWRRRICQSCKYTWTTYEHYIGAEPDVPTIVRDLQIELSIFIERLRWLEGRITMGEGQRREEVTK
jgi:hypothetical protein